MINENIERAHTLSSSFYRSEMNFIQLRERAFRNAWNFAGTFEANDNANVMPFDLLPGFLDEPLLLSKTNDGIRCLSNVCTHRGNLLVEEKGDFRLLRCRYHGRCFGLDGKFRSMPGFEGVEGSIDPFARQGLSQEAQAVAHPRERLLEGHPVPTLHDGRRRAPDPERARPLK